MICRGKGENKEHSNKVIEEVLKHWEENVCGKTTNQKGDEEDEAD